MGQKIENCLSDTLKNDIFTYPYNFITLGEKKERKERKLGKNSGRLKCNLINYTPIFIGGTKIHGNELFLDDRKDFIIPASTLKGEIRNIIEAITHSCIRSKSDKIPNEFKECTNIKELCFACRLFGTIIENSSNSAYSGKVFFTDAKLPKSKGKFENITLKSLMSPKENLKKYYLNTKNKIRGRKFYWHHTDKIKKSDYSVYTGKSKLNIKILEPMREFSFEVSFKNLTDIELGMLIYSLELEKELLHKIGRGKALGLGSCKITIKSFELDGENKYNFSSFILKMEKIDKKIYLDKIEELYLKNNSQLKQLRVILNEKNNLDFSKGAYIKRISNKGNMPEILEYVSEKQF